MIFFIYLVYALSQRVCNLENTSITSTDFYDRTQGIVVRANQHSNYEMFYEGENVPASLELLSSYITKVDLVSVCGRLKITDLQSPARFFIGRGTVITRNFIEICMTCKRLKGKLETQLISSLPRDHLEIEPPFTNTGLDAFGHWSVFEGRATRRSEGTNKVWAVLFTCMSSKAVHGEMLSSLETSTFINPPRRFFTCSSDCAYFYIGSDRCGSVNTTAAAVFTSTGIRSGYAGGGQYGSHHRWECRGFASSGTDNYDYVPPRRCVMFISYCDL